MKRGIAETLLLVSCLLLVIGSLMLVSTSHAAADPNSESTVSCDGSFDKTSCNVQASP